MPQFRFVPGAFALAGAIFALHSAPAAAQTQGLPNNKPLSTCQAAVSEESAEFVTSCGCEGRTLIAGYDLTPPDTFDNNLACQPGSDSGSSSGWAASKGYSSEIDGVAFEQEMNRVQANQQNDETGSQAYWDQLTAFAEMAAEAGFEDGIPMYPGATWDDTDETTRRQTKPEDGAGRKAPVSLRTALNVFDAEDTSGGADLRMDGVSVFAGLDILPDGRSYLSVGALASDTEAESRLAGGAGLDTTEIAATAFYGRRLTDMLNLEISGRLASQSTDSSRIVAGAPVTADYNATVAQVIVGGSAMFRPAPRLAVVARVNQSVAYVDREGFTESDGTVTPGAERTVGFLAGQLSAQYLLSPRLALTTRHTISGRTIEPGGLTLGDDAFSYTPRVGLALYGESWALAADIGAVLLREDYDSVSGSVRLRLPL